jgi:hypothetical protein
VAARGNPSPVVGTAAQIAVLRWLADENFNNNIVRALFRESRDLDIVRAQEIGLTGNDDETC